MTNSDLPRDPLIGDTLERCVPSGPWPDDWAGISARAERRRPRRIGVVGGAVAVAACTALVVLTVALVRDGESPASSPPVMPDGYGMVGDDFVLGDAPSPTVETTLPAIEESKAVVRSEVDGVRFLAGPRVGDGSLCLTVTVPARGVMARCGLTDELIAAGVAYTVVNDWGSGSKTTTDSVELYGTKTVYGIAPVDTVRVTDVQTAKSEVKNRAFVITVLRPSNVLTTVRSDGSRPYFPLRPLRPASERVHVASSAAVVSETGEIDYPPSIVAKVDSVNSVFERCMRENGATVRKVPDPSTPGGATAINGDTTPCRAQLKAANQLANSAEMRAASNSRQAATRELGRCVGRVLNLTEERVWERLNADRVDVAVRSACVESVRRVAADRARS